MTKENPSSSEKVPRKKLKDRIAEGYRSISSKTRKKVLLILTVAGVVWGISEWKGDSVNNVSDTNNQDVWSLIKDAVENSEGRDVENIQDADYVAPNVIRVELDKEYDVIVPAEVEKGHWGLFYVMEDTKNFIVRAYRWSAQLVGADDRIYYNVDTGKFYRTEKDAIAAKAGKEVKVEKSEVEKPTKVEDKEGSADFETN